MLFFRCGNAVVEVAAPLQADALNGDDSFGGLAWRARSAQSVRARLASSLFDVSELRKGRKPGTEVFTVRDRTNGVPTLMLET